MAENGMSLDVAVALLMQRSDASDQRMDEKFEEVSRRLDELTEQVKKTNGRVNLLENGHTSLTERVKNLWYELRSLKATKKEESGENRTLRAFHAWLVLGTIAGTVAFMKYIEALVARP